MADKPPVLLTPRERFQQSGDRIRMHRAMLERDGFQLSLDAAMLEYQRAVMQTSENNPNGALAGYFRLLGAQEFAQCLVRLAEPPAPSGNLITPATLNHRA